MILSCNYEELTALNAAAERVLSEPDAGGVAAPSQVIADIEALAPRLTGDLAVESFDELRGIERATRFLMEDALRQMDHHVLAAHPAAESAVASYFDYAHLLTFHERVRNVGTELAAIEELMTGRDPTDENTPRFTFPES